MVMLQTMPRTWLIASPRFFLKSVETEAGVRLMANVRAGSSSLDLPLDQCLCFNCLIPTGRASYASLLEPPASPQPASSAIWALHFSSRSSSLALSARSRAFANFFIAALNNLLMTRKLSVSSAPTTACGLSPILSIAAPAAALRRAHDHAVIARPFPGVARRLCGPWGPPGGSARGLSRCRPNQSQAKLILATLVISATLS